MEKSALRLNDQVPAPIVKSPAPIQDPSFSKIVPYPVLLSVPFAEAREIQTRSRRRRKRLISFIKLEASACAVLVLLLAAGISKQFAQADLTLPFEIAILVAASVVAIIPVIFYGPTRPKYRARRYRPD